MDRLRLVRRLNDLWAIFELDGNLIILPVVRVLCNTLREDGFCYGELLLHDFRCYRHRIPGQTDHVHCDVHLKCPRCGAYYTFGLAIPPEYLSKLQSSRFHGRTLRMELLDIYGDKLPREVVEKLRNWGYWG